MFGIRLACLAQAGITSPALVQEVMAMDALSAIPVSLWIVSHFETLPACVQGNFVVNRWICWGSIFNLLLVFQPGTLRDARHPV